MAQAIGDILAYKVLSNSVLDYLTSILILIIGITIIKLGKKIFFKYLKELTKRTKSAMDDMVIENIEKSLIPLLYFCVFYISAYSLRLDPAFVKILNSASAIILTFVGIRFLIWLTSNTVEVYWRRHGDDPLKRRSLKGFLTIINVVIWSTGIVFLLDNLGFKISAVIAGLGIGGVAVALAAQAILGDLFSYISIVFDRPFEIGDYILVEDKGGTVNYIGIKTTRLTSLNGEQLVFSNSDLTKSRIQNFKRMERRRVAFFVEVEYKESLEQLKKIPDLLRQIVEGSSEITIFERAHFISYETNSPEHSSLIYEIVYYMKTSDHNDFMNTQQGINLKIIEAFEKGGLELKKIYVK